MTAASVSSAMAPPRARKSRSTSRDRRWALRWSYFFLTLFAVFFLILRWAITSSCSPRRNF
jgi:multiple sugar transport system permease protein